ncbi:MBL fold metallo-hydrolase [Dysgonomonas sp. GY617]|uniref:MBL fold metallo-hydrolase n=1 Tax=Dysgonomonas sp. GY617 TaxID=2780420 RepID=UPI0018834506|nr:MBL fold metallo-hydrolase [Dysgonomonas sp. GY617]MBF0574812.1 MBL fold metallo-hydrolase [Dysgonomonas sp. GY617]
MDIISVKSYFTGANVSKISVFTNLTRYFLNNGSSLYTKKVEYDFWMSENPDFSRSKIKDTAMIVAMVKHIRNILTTLQPQIKLVADKDILLDCMQVEIAPGHTPGHIISTIYSGDEKLVAMADIVHATSILFTNPRWGTSFDYDFELGIKTRVAVLKKLSKDNALIFGYHQPYPGIGHIKELSVDSYEWVPADFATPQLKD